MKSIVLSFAFLMLSISISTAQSLRGQANLRAVETKKTNKSEAEEALNKRPKMMRYGNVQAFDKDNNLIESVITDEFGNYELNFADTGMYQIQIKYAGYETMEQWVTVDDDLNNDFTLDRDELQKERVLSEKAYSLNAGYLNGGICFSANNTQNSNNAIRNGLTSGEINDFSKWELWNDYVEDDLSLYQRTWQFYPKTRYVVQLTNEDKNALVGAYVSLVDGSGKEIWQSITDNTGKAELWASIFGENHDVKKLKIHYKDESKEIKNPKPFDKGINTIKLDQPCGAPNNVDIAFVVDGTGSMADEINFIKRDLNEVMYETQNLYSNVSIRYGSVFYRDKEEDYLTKHKDFTDVLSESLVFVDEQFAKGGRDMPEAVDAGLDAAINQLSWSENARTKLLFLILDAPPHTDEASVQKMHELTAQAAAKGIKIIPITGSGINKSGEYLMRSLALATNGTYVFLTDHSGIGVGHIDPTVDEYEMKLLSEKLGTIIKSNIYYPECEELIPEFELNYPDSVVAFNQEIGQIFQEIDSISNQAVDSLGTDIVDHNVKQFEWKYYPNPTRDYVTIEVSEEIEFIYLTDLTGKLLQRIDFSGSTLKRVFLGDYPMGLYLLRYPVGKQWVSGKIVLMG